MEIDFVHHEKMLALTVAGYRWYLRKIEKQWVRIPGTAGARLGVLKAIRKDGHLRLCLTLPMGVKTDSGYGRHHLPQLHLTFPSAHAEAEALCQIIEQIGKPVNG